MVSVLVAIAGIVTFADRLLSDRHATRRTPTMTGQSWLWIAVMASAFDGTTATSAQPATPRAITNTAGLRLVVDADNARPVLRVLLPGKAESDRSIEVIFPEHVSGRRHAQADVEQLYLFRPGSSGARPAWRQQGQAVVLRHGARGSRADDGSGDPRGRRRPVSLRVPQSLHRLLRRDLRRHRPAADIEFPRRPSRTHLRASRRWVRACSVQKRRPVSRCRSRIGCRLDISSSFTWPVPSQRVERRGDGISYYNKSRAVDEPFIATVSADGAWVVASVARDVGNVWSNPELTCQHVDPAGPARAERTSGNGDQDA